ncbi:MAG: DUF4159 domain-containing protein [Deltaproteobacteria bacterium]|nr:DUF4159 domain-containing protein [Deltaproteobacteria bacterium]
MPELSRRELLRAGLVALGSPWLLGAAGASDLRVAQLITKGTWNPRPESMRRLLWEVALRTSIEVDLEVVPVEAAKRALFRYPFLYWAGTGAFAPLEEEEVRQLRRFLTYGGTILIDSADAEPGGPFDASIRRDLGRILPRQELERIPRDHTIYKSFYLIDHQAGRTLHNAYLEGTMLEKRLAICYSQNDLGGAWARDAFGRWEFQVTPGGERQRETTFRLGINLVMYALCLDYKDDLVHAPFILKRRR